jgi:predicted transcriptional regulator of viral defense system
VNLISEHLRGATRYVWGDFTPPFELALTIGKKPYLSHATAVYIHGLTDQIPKTIYINDEQSEKHFGPASLTQEAIDRAFARPPRTSRAVYTVDQLRFVVISGKFTGHLEVGQSATDDGIVADVTKLERTLIDIAVRPEYAGGPYSVLEAYKAAKDKISLNVLTATLKKLGHAYPYHQVIGFYLQKAGYDPAKLEPLKRLGMQFKFYLTHGMDGSDLDSDWQLHIPKGF